MSKSTTSLAEPDTSTSAASYLAEGLSGYLLRLMVHGGLVHIVPSSVTMGHGHSGELHRPYAGALDSDLWGPGQGRG
jgi:hypothetical protein